MVPSWEAEDPQQSGREQSPSLFQGTQCLVSDSSLYIPDSSLACVVAKPSLPPMVKIHKTYREGDI